MTKFVHLNGSLVPTEQAMVPISDRGFLYGDSVFETMAAHGRKIFRQAAHLQRFVASADTLGIVLPCPPDEIAERIAALLRENAMSKALVRMTLSRGSGPRGLGVSACTSPSFVIQCFPPPPERAALRARGLTLAIAATRRMPTQSLPSTAKIGNYVSNILAYREALTLGADDALMLSIDGDIVECTTSNIFFVQNGTLVTPSLASGAIPGITRAVVMELAAGRNIACEETRLRPDSLTNFDEAFCTNSGSGIMPVGRIGSHSLTIPGKVSNCLEQDLHDLITREANRP